MEAAADLPGYNVYRPTDLGATGGLLPVVVWANGGCVRHDATWRTLLERWAAAGFLVVAITEPPDREATVEDRTTADDQAKAIDWAVEQNAEDAADHTPVTSTSTGSSPRATPAAASRRSRSRGPIPACEPCSSSPARASAPPRRESRPAP